MPPSKSHPPNKPGGSRQAKAPDQKSPTDGFYAGGFRPGELQDLKAALEYDLSAEIDMLRVATRRVFELSNGAQELDEAIASLRALGIAATRLSGVLRTQVLLDGQRRDVSTAISKAINDVLEEMKVK